MENKKEIWIFLSHSNDDFNKVRLIRNYLEEKSYRPLMFYLKCLESEEEIYDLITREIDVRTRFILCDSVNAQASTWVQREMEYVSSRIPPRSYLRIDLSMPFETIQRELDIYINQMNIFISYSSKDMDIAKMVYSRLSKYDLNVLVDFNMMKSGESFENVIKEGLSHAANNGFIVALYSDGNEDSSFVKNELRTATMLGANIILFALTPNAYEHCNHDESLRRYTAFNLCDYQGQDLVDKIVNIVLSKVYPIGGLITCAENFRTGILGTKDIHESQKLYQHLKEEAEASDNPYALQFLGRRHEYGYGGNPIDLNEALMYYTMAIHEPGGPKDESFLKHVRELNEKINKFESSK